MSDSRSGTRPTSRTGSSAGNPRAGGAHAGGGRPPSSRTNSRRTSPVPVPPPPPLPPPTAAGSETDEDWDLANVTDEEDDRATATGGAGLSTRGSVRGGSVADNPPPTGSLSGEGRSNTVGGTAPGSRRSGVNLAAGDGMASSADPVHFPPGTLAALSALPLGEAWRLVRARVALDVNSIDAWKLYAACVELLDVVKDANTPLPTRLLATFLLYALYMDPSLPIPPSVILGPDDLSSFGSESTPESDPISFYALARMPSDLPLLSGIPPELPSSASTHLAKFPTTIRLAMAVACAHPFLGVLLHVARHAPTNAERLLAKLLLVSPRADRPSQASSRASPSTAPFPLLVRDPDFLAKTAVHLATFSDALSGYADPKVAQFADAILKVLEEYVGAMDLYLMKSGLIPGLVAMEQTEWSYTTADLMGGTNDSASTLTESPSSSPTIRSSSTPQFSSPLPAPFLDPCVDPTPDTSVTPTLPPDTAAALTQALQVASTSPVTSLSLPLPARIPSSMLASVSLFQGLLTYSPDVAKAVVARVHPIEAIAQDVLLHVALPIRVSHLNLLHELWQSGVLSKAHLPMFASRVIGLALGSASPRTVQLAAKFLNTHIKDLPADSLVEVRNFCADYLMFKDCADLFAQVAQMTSSSSSSALEPATVSQAKPPAEKLPAPPVPSSSHASRGKRRNRRV